MLNKYEYYCNDCTKESILKFKEDLNHTRAIFRDDAPKSDKAKRLYKILGAALSFLIIFTLGVLIGILITKSSYGQTIHLR